MLEAGLIFVKPAFYNLNFITEKMDCFACRKF